MPRNFLWLQYIQANKTRAASRGMPWAHHKKEAVIRKAKKNSLTNLLLDKRIGLHNLDDEFGDAKHSTQNRSRHAWHCSMSGGQGVTLLSTGYA